MFAWQAAFRCRRGLHSARGGRATGRTAIRNSTSWCKGFRENDTPLDVLVIDMDWHLSHEQLVGDGRARSVGRGYGWTGYTWNKFLFPDPDDFLKKVHDEGLKATLNLHPAAGIEPWEAAYPAMARAMGVDPATKKYIPFDPVDKRWADKLL